jgi:DNA-binding response OmpR family regulator
VLPSRQVLKTHVTKPRILLTEDDADTREVLALLLSAEGYEPVTVDDGNDALDIARTEHFDLYILDNWMPTLSGVELCKTLREFDTTTPILFYSGVAHETEKSAAFAAGANGYLIKPVDSDSLLVEVSRLIKPIA